MRQFIAPLAHFIYRAAVRMSASLTQRGADQRAVHRQDERLGRGLPMVQADRHDARPFRRRAHVPAACGRGCP